MMKFVGFVRQKPLTPKQIDTGTLLIYRVVPLHTHACASGGVLFKDHPELLTTSLRVSGSSGSVIVPLLRVNNEALSS